MFLEVYNKTREQIRYKDPLGNDQTRLYTRQGGFFYAQIQ